MITQEENTGLISGFNNGEDGLWVTAFAQGDDGGLGDGGLGDRWQLGRIQLEGCKLARWWRRCY